MDVLPVHDTFTPLTKEAIPILGSPWTKRSPNAARGTPKLIERLRRTLLAPPTDAERLHALFLGKGRSLRGEARLAIGTADALSLRVRDLFARALALDATGIILAHNHPSGDCRPSERDFQATQYVSKLGAALEIELLDHLIFTQSAVYSMRAKGEL